MLDPGNIQAKFDFTATGNRIEEPHALEAGAALTFAAVGDNHVIKRGFLTAAPS
jgi:hypothetical protein